MADRLHEVVVVGGGPAGLTAALELSRAGARVAIVEENAQLGGQYFRRRSADVLRRYGDLRPAGSRLIEAVRAAGVECLTEHLVWGAEEERLWTSHVRTGAVRAIGARRIILATGAYERSIPFPGWTLPGVCTPGLALHLAHGSRVAVGGRVALGGTGPFLLVAAVALLELGVQVAAIVERNEPYRFAPRALAVALAPARLWDYARYMMQLRRHRVALLQGWHVLGAEGRERVEAVHIGSCGGSATERIAVDALCVAYGFRPSNELALLLGCEARRDPVTHDLFPRCDAFGRTSRPDVLVAGELRGIAGAQAAANRGRLAAYAAMQDLGLQAPGTAHVRRALAHARRHEAFARTIDHLFPVSPSLYAEIADDTLVCRCESVTAKAIRDASAQAWTDLHATKSTTRAGMGPCQGRECAHAVAALVAARSGLPPARFNVRMPIKPIPMPTR